MLKEIRIRFQHDGCWLQETTERYPSVVLVVSSIYQVEDNVHIDLLAHAPDRATVDRAHAEWKTDPRIHKISKLYDGPKGLRFHVAYTAAHSIYPHIVSHTPISLGAVSVAGGVEHYTIVGEADDVQDLIAVMRQEGHADVVAIKDLDEVPESGGHGLAASLHEQLTDKQFEALVLAAEKNYYTWPRLSSASDLADLLGLSIPAFLDHLRRAEQKVLRMMVESLQATNPARYETAKVRLAQRSRETEAARVLRKTVKRKA